MKFQLRKCISCHKFTLKNQCNYCNNQTISAHPAKFSPDDKYFRYRILNKYQQDNL